MSAEEGLRRIKAIGRGVMLYGGLAGLSLWAIGLFILRRAALAELFVLIGVPLLAGGVLWVVAYIVEGFLRPTGQRQ